MNSNSTLFSVGNFDLKLKHLLIIGILSLSFSISFLIRSQPADYAWELNEFDPFFNYRATEYIVNNGVSAYFEWHDDLSWHPLGRDVSKSSQVMLHLTAAITYGIFGGNMELYDYAIIFPVVFGSLTCIVIFALVRVIGGTTAGLFSAILFSVSIPIIIRGQIGWFKSEPLGLFLSILGLYLFLSGINSNNHKIAFMKLISAGIFTTLSLSAWGGNQTFLVLLGIFILVLPILRKDHKFLIWGVPIFSLSLILPSLVIERLGINFFTGIGGMSIIIPTILLILSIIIQNKSSQQSKIRNGLLLLFGIIIVSSFILIVNVDSHFLPLPSYRYLNAINPFLTTSDPLVDSISEHATTTLPQSFYFHSVLMIFAGIAIWIILKNSKKVFIKKDMISISIIFGILGVYMGSTFLRLEVFAAMGIIILSSLGLSILCKEFFSNMVEKTKRKNILMKTSFGFGILFLLIIPLTLPPNSTVFAVTDNPPTIANGGTTFKISTTDWTDSLMWIKNNTPENAVIASWWDYGYWIQTIGERTTLADNSTQDTKIIQKIAKIFLATPDEGWQSLQELEADYFVIFVAGQRLNLDSIDNQPLYSLAGGGDESKKQWFMRIANEPLTKYLHPDGFSGTNHFWNETLIGKMIPFEPIGYVNFQTNEQSLTYRSGFAPISEKSIKLPENGNGPLKLVYSSPSFDTEKGGTIIGVFVYEINDDYVPKN